VFPTSLPSMPNPGTPGLGAKRDKKPGGSKAYEAKVPPPEIGAWLAEGGGSLAAPVATPYHSGTIRVLQSCR
jgi:hypothetical protein